MKKVMLVGVVGLVTSISPGCGGNDTPATPGAIPTPAPVTTSLFSQSYPINPSRTSTTAVYGYQDVSSPYAGTVTAAFAWTFATSQIEMVVTTNACSDPAGAYFGSCTVYGADHRRANPADVTFPLAASGVIRIWLFNFTTVPESGVLNVTILH